MLVARGSTVDHVLTPLVADVTMPVWATVALTLGASVIAASAALIQPMVQMRIEERKAKAAAAGSLRAEGLAYAVPIRSSLDRAAPALVADAAWQIGDLRIDFEALQAPFLVYTAAHPDRELDRVSREAIGSIRLYWVQATRANLIRRSTVEGDLAATFPTAPFEKPYEHASALMNEVIDRIQRF